MRLHTDVLTRSDLIAALPARDVYVESTPHGSRSRHHAHNVSLSGHGARHTRRRNGGTYGAGDGRAATWSDWGRWLAALYVKDPKMIAGQYTDAIDFHAKTHGLFRPDAKRTPATLAGEVRELHRRAPNCGRTHPINATARRNDLSEYVVKAAIYGE